MAKRITDEEFAKMLINKQFEISGNTNVSWDDIIGEPDGVEEPWYMRYTTTKDLEEEFKKYLTEQYKKRFKLRGKALETNTAMFLLNYGLKRSDFDWGELEEDKE